ncbi:MAG TPA: MoaD/ThiS family protein [Candidatus Limnocylindrales bacterium]|nr:MoaD/ThiS family protein [Candidatus Limnocylindrales bacterium]
MATVWIPSLMRSLTHGVEKVTVSGSTLGEVLDNLDKAYPGLKNRLWEEGRITPHVTVVIDGEMGIQGLWYPVQEHSEIHFLPVISGGVDLD